MHSRHHLALVSWLLLAAPSLALQTQIDPEPHVER